MLEVADLFIERDRSKGYWIPPDPLAWRQAEVAHLSDTQHSSKGYTELCRRPENRNTSQAEG